MSSTIAAPRTPQSPYQRTLPTILAKRSAKPSTRGPLTLMQLCRAVQPKWWRCMRKMLISGRRVKKSQIDDSVSERDPEFLANLICAEDLDAEVKEHLARVVFELLTGKKNFRRVGQRRKM